MATHESLLRWKAALADMEQAFTMPSGQKMRQQLNSSEVQSNMRPNSALHRFFFNMITNLLATPFRHLWATDRPADTPILTALQPVANAIDALTPQEALLPQWDHLNSVVHTARLALDGESVDIPTIDDVIADLLSSLRTTLLVSCMGKQGSTAVLAEEYIRHIRSFSGSTPAPVRFYDVATNTFVDSQSQTTLNLAGFKYFANRDAPPVDSRVESLPEYPPAVAKQFAAQAIVSFYTDWEEHYRSELAVAHGCSPYDFQIDYFGDINRMRQDYVHNRGVCSGSAYCKQLKWFAQGDLMVPTPEDYVELLAAFPADALRKKPQRRTGGTERVPIRADISVIRAFEKLAAEVRETKSVALNEALSDWTARNSPSTTNN